MALEAARRVRLSVGPDLLEANALRCVGEVGDFTSCLVLGV